MENDVARAGLAQMRAMSGAISEEIPGMPPAREGTLERLDLLAGVHELCVKGEWAVGRVMLGLAIAGKGPDGESGDEMAVRAYFYGLLEENRYYEASALAWHREVFDQRPWHVERIFNALRDFDLVLFMGGSKLSKTFGVAAWHALDWMRDAADTSLRYGTMEEGNLRQNLWANLKQLISTSLFRPVLGRVSDREMTLGTPGQRPECGLEAVLIPKSGVSSSKLKGCHPKNFRPENHPVWGRSTRVRIILDEAQALLPGVKADFGSPKTSVNSRTRVMKITLTMNPEDEKHWAVQLAAPEDGFTEQNMDALYDYTTLEGWRVCRLDARMHENVITRSEIYPNQVTYESVLARMKGGTEMTAEFYVFCAGWPPPSKATEVVVPSTWFEASIGEPVFTGRVLMGAGADIACIVDKAFLAVGRHGLATGWTDFQGVDHAFENRRNAGEMEMRTVVVLDELIRLESRDPGSLGDEIKKLCTQLRIDPEFVVGDETGVGFGTISHLKRFWGPVTGVNFKENPTNLKILVEDKEGAEYQVHDIVSEMYWTVRQWMSPQVRGFFINPNCSNKVALKHQLTSRGYKYGLNNRILVEPKDKFMKRNGNSSPDEADAVVQMTLAFRLRGLQLPALTDEQVLSRGKEDDKGARSQPSGNVTAVTSDEFVTLKRGGEISDNRPRIGRVVEAPLSLRRAG